MATRKFDSVLDPEMFSLKDTSLGKINGVLNNASQNCDIFGQVGQLVDNALSALNEAIGTVSDMVSSALKSALDGMMSAVNAVYSKIEGWFNQLWDESGISAIKDTISGFMNSVNSAIDSIMSTIEGMVSDMMGAVGSLVSATCGAVTGALQNLNASMVSQNPVMAAAAQATDTVKKLPGMAAASPQQLSAAVGQVAGGQSLLNSGIQTKVASLTSSVGSIQSLTRALKI